MTAQDPTRQFVANSQTPQAGQPSAAVAQPPAAAAPQGATSTVAAQPIRVRNPRATQLMQEMKDIGSKIQAVSADDSLSAIGRNSAVGRLRNAYKAKLRQLNDSAYDVLPPAPRKQVQLFQEAQQLKGHMQAIAANPLLTDEERQALMDRHIAAIKEKQSQAQWLQSQPADTDVDAQPPVMP